VTRKLELSHAREILTATNIEDAPLECELLLRHSLKLSRVELYLALNNALNSAQEETFWRLVKRRLNGEPAGYITGHC